MICVILAHPYLHRSHINRAFAEALRALPNLDLRCLYELYPDFDIDVAAEQQALARARVVVWMHPVFWYSVPALLKHWFDKVLAYGWAYGEGGDALHGKRCLWVPITGGTPQDFTPAGLHGHAFESFVPVVEQTARYCGMQWEPPYVVHGANAIDDVQLGEYTAALLERLAPWREAEAQAEAKAEAKAEAQAQAEMATTTEPKTEAGAAP